MVPERRAGIDRGPQLGHRLPMSERVIDFFYDVGSSYSYLATTQIERIESESGWSVRHRPFLLGAVFKATGNTTPASVAAKARWMVLDMARWSELYGIPFALPSRFPLVTLATQRALCAAEVLGGEAALRAFTPRLMQAFWAEDRDVASPEVIAACARAAGLDADAIATGAGEAPAKDLLRAHTDAALAKGAFGAPCFVVGDDLFWGNDRIPLLLHHLARRG